VRLHDIFLCSYFFFPAVEYQTKPLFFRQLAKNFTKQFDMVSSVLVSIIALVSFLLLTNSLASRV
jgi:hypothetical protein